MSKKSIIVFEGIEGTGKSHHINNVAKYLKKNNKKFIQIREPGGSKNSEKIRKLILNNKSTFNKYTDLLLYLSARSENLELIKKNDVLGKLKVTYKDELLDEFNLFALEDVKKLNVFSSLMKSINFLIWGDV